jgi:hypothetical protein
MAQVKFKRRKTNREVITKFIKEADDITLAILRERILTSCDVVIKDSKKKSWWDGMKNCIYEPNFWLNQVKLIYKGIDFEPEN